MSSASSVRGALLLAGDVCELRMSNECRVSRGRLLPRSSLVVCMLPATEGCWEGIFLRLCTSCSGMAASWLSIGSTQPCFAAQAPELLNLATAPTAARPLSAGDQPRLQRRVQAGHGLDPRHAGGHGGGPARRRGRRPDHPRRDGLGQPRA